jgi:hypothetical protein
MADEFFDSSAAKPALGYGRIVHLLKNFKNLTAFNTFVLVDRH